MRVIEASSISELVEETISLVNGWAKNEPKYCWFRGIKDNSLGLQPGAYWRSGYDEMEPLLTFAQEGVVYTPIQDINNWDTYYLAQHHGIPTRLLDWTENLLSALFFAFDGWDGKTIPCIWVTQPDVFNSTFSGKSAESILVPSDIGPSTLWKPSKIAEQQHSVMQSTNSGATYSNVNPLAIFPKKSNKRIVAQQGAFTIHGKDQRCLTEQVHASNTSVDDVFTRIDLKGFDNTTIYKHLSFIGLKRHTMYPDIDNFVKTLKDYYRW